MAVTIDLCRVMAKVRDALVDDVKATIIKKKKIKHMSTVYGEFQKPKFNTNLCTNLVSMHILGRVMLEPLRSRSLVAPFSTTRLRIKEYSSLGLELLSLSF